MPCYYFGLVHKESFLLNFAGGRRFKNNYELWITNFGTSSDSCRYLELFLKITINNLFCSDPARSVAYTFFLWRIFSKSEALAIWDLKNCKVPVCELQVLISQSFLMKSSRLFLKNTYILEVNHCAELCIDVNCYPSPLIWSTFQADRARIFSHQICWVSISVALQKTIYRHWIAVEFE